MQDFNFDIPDVDDRGVSPVIGVVLIVAITAILGAIIVTFVFGFPAQVHDNTRAGADLSVDGSTATVTWISEGNAEKLPIQVTNATGSSETLSLDSTGEFVTVENLGGDGGMCSPDAGMVTVNDA